MLAKLTNNKRLETWGQRGTTRYAGAYAMAGILLVILAITMTSCVRNPPPPLKQYKRLSSNTQVVEDKIRLDALEKWEEGYLENGRAYGESEEQVKHRLEELTQLREKYEK